MSKSTYDKTSKGVNEMHFIYEFIKAEKKDCRKLTKHEHLRVTQIDKPIDLLI